MNQLSTKPFEGTPIGYEAGKPVTLEQLYWNYFDEIEQKLNSLVFGRALFLPSYAKADLPTADQLPDAAEAWQVFVTDDIGGSIPAFWDGTDWRRVTDRAVIA